MEGDPLTKHNKRMHVEPAAGPERETAPDEDANSHGKTPRKALEGYVANLAATSQNYLTPDFVRDTAAAAGILIPAPERIDDCLKRLSHDFSPAALLALAEAIVEETKKKASRTELSINEVEAVLCANLSEGDLRDIIGRAALAALAALAAAEPAAPAATGDAAHWKAKAEEHLNLARQVQADFDNFRKRTLRDAEQLRKLATLELVKNLLAVLDALDSALTRADDPGEEEGILKVRKLLFTQLQKEGLEEVGAVEEPFDPAYHEAIAEEERAGIEVETVIELCRRGYRLGDRVIRPAMVKVAVPQS